MAHRETFLKIHMHRQHFVLQTCMEEVFQLHFANVCRISKKYSNICKIPFPRFARKFPTWNPLMLKELVRKIVRFNNRGIGSRECILINSSHFQHSSVGKPFPCWRRSFKNEVRSCSCFSSDAMYWIIEWSSIWWSTSRHLDQFEDIISRILK